MFHLSFHSRYRCAHSLFPWFEVIISAGRQLLFGLHQSTRENVRIIMEAFNESVFEHISGSDYCGISTGERTVKNALAKLHSAYPDSVTLIAENQDGGVFYHVPWKWIRIRPPRNSNLTEEQRAALRDRARMNFKLDESSWNFTEFLIGAVLPNKIYIWTA